MTRSNSTLLHLEILVLSTIEDWQWRKSWPKTENKKRMAARQFYCCCMLCFFWACREKRCGSIFSAWCIWRCYDMLGDVGQRLEKDSKRAKSAMMVMKTEWFLWRNIARGLRCGCGNDKSKQARTKKRWICNPENVGGDVYASNQKHVFLLLKSSDAVIVIAWTSDQNVDPYSFKRVVIEDCV